MQAEITCTRIHTYKWRTQDLERATTNGRFQATEMPITWTRLTHRQQDSRQRPKSIHYSDTQKTVICAKLHKQLESRFESRHILWVHTFSIEIQSRGFTLQEVWVQKKKLQFDSISLKIFKTFWNGTLEQWAIKLITVALTILQVLTWLILEKTGHLLLIDFDSKTKRWSKWQVDDHLHETSNQDTTSVLVLSLIKSLDHWLVKKKTT